MNNNLYNLVKVDTYLGAYLPKVSNWDKASKEHRFLLSARSQKQDKRLNLTQQDFIFTKTNYIKQLNEQGESKPKTKIIKPMACKYS